MHGCSAHDRRVGRALVLIEIERDERVLRDLIDLPGRWARENEDRKSLARRRGLLEAKRAYGPHARSVELVDGHQPDERLPCDQRVGTVEDNGCVTREAELSARYAERCGSGGGGTAVGRTAARRDKDRKERCRGEGKDSHAGDDTTRRTAERHWCNWCTDHALNLAPRANMPVKHVRFGKGFNVALSNKRGQSASMVIAPGDCEGGPDNRHRGADQWLFVLSGSGVAVLAGRKHRLKAGSLVLIERGTTHEIRNTGRSPL